MDKMEDGQKEMSEADKVYREARRLTTWGRVNGLLILPVGHKQPSALNALLQQTGTGK